MHEVRDKKFQSSAVYFSLFRISPDICTYMLPAAKVQFRGAVPWRKGGGANFSSRKKSFIISPGATRDSSGWSSKQSTPDISLEF